MRDYMPQLLPLILAVLAFIGFFAIVRMQGTSGGGFGNRLGAIGDISEKISRAFSDLVGFRFIGGARASLNFASIAAGLQERLTISVPGALLGDFARAAPEADLEAGLEFTAYVSVADVVTVTMSNNTAGAVDPAAVVFRVGVMRETRR